MAERVIPNFERLKVAIVSPYSMEPTGGVQKHIEEYSSYLLSQGHETIVISAINPQIEEPKHVNWATKRVFLSTAVPQRHNGTVAHVPRRVPTNPVEIYRAWQNIKADIVHSHDPYLSSASLELIIHSRLPLLNSSPAWQFATFHAFNSDNQVKYGMISQLRHVFSPMLDGTIVVSQATQQFAQRYFPRNHERISNGIDTKRFSDQTECLEQYKDEKLNIVYVGRLEERKGVIHLLNVFAQVKKQRPNTRLIIAGDGPQKSLLEEMVTKEGIADVVFLGVVSDDDLPKVYNTADICAFYATHGEAQGRVLIEAMSARKAVMAGDNEGYKTVISDMENGMLVDPKNTQLAVSKMITLIDNQELRQSLAERGLLSAQEYDWQNVGRRIIDFYRQKIAA